ncbi:hypothetical protein GWI33_000739 [Rhynchophorus ferrugineus]|uniref:Uncharacterized protein n=1 Tax=Rhynchophorus ferrugineus TaxID=354439 RepID=A0A834IZI8_RHYFE|nr:hypothetical protein GWI33_000739 [Rhynchophorus ferrugineus]
MREPCPYLRNRLVMKTYDIGNINLQEEGGFDLYPPGDCADDKSRTRIRPRRSGGAEKTRITKCFPGGCGLEPRQC